MRRSLMIPRMLLGSVLLVALIPASAHAAIFYAAYGFEGQSKADEAIMPGFWGSLATAPDGILEPYTETSGGAICPPNTGCPAYAILGKRIVQYFDRGRMEYDLRLTQTYGPADPVPITDGLLATEMVTGRIQIGDNDFDPATPATIPMVGDATNTAPTYAQLATTASSLLAQAPPRMGGITREIDALGNVGEITNGPTTGMLILDGYDRPTQHNVLRTFATFRAKIGLRAIGHAISEPFRVTVTIAGTPRMIATQVFERRVLFVEITNAGIGPVETTDIGRHYVAWRYPTGLTVTTADYSPFVGTYTREGIEFEFHADGTGSMRWCDDYPASTCDLFDVNQQKRFVSIGMFFNRTTSDTAYGAVSASPRTGPVTAGTVELQRLPNALATLSTGNRTPDLLLCGYGFAKIAPPNVVAAHPCGDDPGQRQP